MNKLKIVCAIIVKDDKVFCCKRGAGRSLEDFWEFPNGNIKNDEYIHQAIVREIKEKFNSVVYPEQSICESEYDNIEVKAKLCTLISGNLELSEHTDSKWLSLSELDSVNWAPTDKPIVEKVKELLSKQTYTLCLDKNDYKVGNISGGWDFNFKDVKESVEVIWQDNSSYITAYRKFIEAIKKQQHEFRDLKTVSKWQTIRLYDATGKQIEQERG